MAGEQWPPVWKRIEECPQYYMICPYLDKLPFETRSPSFYEFSKYPIDRFKMFLKQVRESRGYDITTKPPGSPFTSTDILLQDESYYEVVIGKCKLVVEEINDGAKMHDQFYVFHKLEIHDQFYVFHKLERVVEVLRLRKVLLTFVVNEVSSNELKTVQAFFFAKDMISYTLKSGGLNPNPPKLQLLSKMMKHSIVLSSSGCE